MVAPVLERQKGLLVLRKGDSTFFLRMDAINEDTLKQYFDLLEDTLQENDLVNSPTKLYNVDESGIPLDASSTKVVTVKVRYQSTGRKGQIIVVACGNASRQVLLPLIIFDTKNIRQSWMKNEVPGTMYGSSDKGWINTDLSKVGFMIFFYQMQLVIVPCCCYSMGIVHIISQRLLKNMR